MRILKNRGRGWCNDIATGSHQPQPFITRAHTHTHSATQEINNTAINQPVWQRTTVTTRIHANSVPTLDRQAGERGSSLHAASRQKTQLDTRRC